MKSCDEMVNSLFERREKYKVEQKRKRKMYFRIVTTMSCGCLVAFCVWQSGMFDKPKPINTINSISVGEKKNNSSSADQNSSGHYPDNYVPNGEEKTMISSFKVDETVSASYETPENGEFYFSIPLQKAMDKYKDGVLYRIFIDVFSNKEQLSTDSKEIKDECERLSNNGYIVAYETFFDGNTNHYYLTLHATYEDLTSFIASKNYGYFMFLYDERLN